MKSRFLTAILVPSFYLCLGCLLVICTDFVPHSQLRFYFSTSQAVLSIHMEMCPEFTYFHMLTKLLAFLFLLLRMMFVLSDFKCVSGLNCDLLQRLDSENKLYCWLKCEHSMWESGKCFIELA